MIKEFICQENTIILAVIPANSDLANADALKLARTVDPNGNRTIGVLTKLDLMDEGTDALDIFEGRSYPLKRGYVGVVSRSQKDINEKKSIHEAMAFEANWFKNSPYRFVEQCDSFSKTNNIWCLFSTLKEKMGSQFLQQSLHEQLERHIKDRLPAVRTDLETKLKDLNQTLTNLGYEEYPDKSRRALYFK